MRASKPRLIEILIIAVVCGPPLGFFWLFFLIFFFGHRTQSSGADANILRSFVTAVEIASATVPGIYAIGLVPALVGAFAANALFGLRGHWLLRVAGLAFIGGLVTDLPLLFLAAASPPLAPPDKPGPYLLFGATGAMVALCCYLLWWLGSLLRPRRNMVS
jgi:hypothetical protein